MGGKAISHRERHSNNEHLVGQGFMWIMLLIADLDGLVKVIKSPPVPQVPLKSKPIFYFSPPPLSLVICKEVWESGGLGGLGDFGNFDIFILLLYYK